MIQTPTRVNIEFIKSAGTIREGRMVRLNYTGAQVPLQLQNTVDQVNLSLCLCSLLYIQSCARN